MRSMVFALVIAASVIGAACQSSVAPVPTSPTTPISITLTSPSVSVGQEVHIIAHGGNGDYSNVGLVVYNYGGYAALDMSTCLGYLRKSFSGGSFLFRPEPTCSSRPTSVMVYVSDTDHNRSEMPLTLVY